MNKTKISSRGQTVIPLAIRKQYGLRTGSYLEWQPMNTRTIIVRHATRKQSSTNWSEWARTLRGLGKEIWEDIDPVEYVHQSWHGKHR